ncbi:MAG: hypothetical protein ABI634_05925 [Acidobacteriota bacterium]
MRSHARLPGVARVLTVGDREFATRRAVVGDQRRLRLGVTPRDIEIRNPTVRSILAVEPT